MRPDGSRLGANVGFGYLTDDDDDSSSGGGAGDLFDAFVNASLPATADVGDTITIDIDITASGGAQTSGSVRVSLSGVSLSGSPTTVDLDGWTQTGWTLASGEWFNTLTKASVAVGTYNLQFTAVPSSAGTLTVTTNYGGTHQPATTQATGSGNSRSVTIAALAFDVDLDASPNPSPEDSAVTLTAHVSASGLPQTNGFFRLRVSHSVEAATSAPSELDTDGWTSTGWTEVTGGSGIWQADFTLATVSNASYELTFLTVPQTTGTLTFQTYGLPPSTSQATGSGDITTVAIVSP